MAMEKNAKYYGASVAKKFDAAYASGPEGAVAKLTFVNKSTKNKR